MSVVEREKETTTLTVPATEVEKKLQQMIDLVRAGRWTRNTQGAAWTKRCTMGLIDHVLQ